MKKVLALLIGTACGLVLALGGTAWIASSAPAAVVSTTPQGGGVGQGCC
ncbi:MULTISPECIES: hypothetical protein [Kitasatospora]|nr:hypothetical protein [Kitasatospora sp. GP30]MDH6140318.1 hypothetical protein [Kitasatospora sp. GP30]